LGWIKDLFAPEQRTWEDFYRNRWQYDKIVRSTHGVNCTGSCSWNIYVKNGMVTWEMQALDYPEGDKAIPGYEPRGCQRGISCSWYIYSPMRVKYPYVRGALLTAWRKALDTHGGDTLAAYTDIMEDEEARRSIQQARGKGGFRRSTWAECNAIMAAANIYTAQKYGPDRIVGFSPIPAMSMLSHASGSRFLQLMGGVSLSFYDWYCDLPPAFPETWGEQTDVAESADWYNSKFIAVVGSNVLMTRTPDAHFLVEARHQGSKVVVFAPDFSQTAKIADEWVPLNQGQDAAFWMAVTHVILTEYFVNRQVPQFIQYIKNYSDLPFLVVLTQDAQGHWNPGRQLRAADIESMAHEEHAEWKLPVLDEDSAELRLPGGTIGHRWQSEKGQWNLKMEDPATGQSINPLLLFNNINDESVPVVFSDFSEGTNDKVVRRGVASRVLQGKTGPIRVTTAMELLMAQYGVARKPGTEGEWPGGYEDENAVYTPAWQERFSGVGQKTVTTFAREWARTAEVTGGKCSVIIGAGVNHWYHNNLIYRATIVPLVLCGCVGKNGGGLNHYVGQEKLAPQASWAPIAFATDWGAPPRLMNGPSFHYMHSSQWRYDRNFGEVCPVSDDKNPIASGHTADKQVLAVRNGWLPCYPQFDKPNHEVVREARAAGAETEADVSAHVVQELKSRRLKFTMEDPDAPQCWPRVWYIWRGNALLSSAKGHEYFLKHYLGTHHNCISEEQAEHLVEDVVWREQAESGKFDLIVDLNFRMDSSALYSDIVLPAATYYEKNDLNTTDMHPFMHPLQAAVKPCWESKSDWEIFRDISYATQELAKMKMPEPLEDVVIMPLLHDTPGEIAQPTIKDWSRGECEPVPGKTMPNIKVVERDFTQIYDRYISLGRTFRNGGLGVHGTRYDVDDLYDEFMKTRPVERWGGVQYPSIKDEIDAANVVLHFAAESNGECAYRAYVAESKKTGIDHTHLAEPNRSVRMDFKNISAQPRRLLTTPYWTGITNNDRTYSAYCQNVEELIPWRTLTGRQSLYYDHEAYVAFGEHLPTFKPRAEMLNLGDLEKSESGSGTLQLNYLTPHGKWHIHTTFGDTLRMQTLSRGCEPLWLNDKDADLAGIEDNDWVEIYNDHGVVCTRACVSARIPRGLCIIYHAPERTIGIPKSPERKNRRAGGHNSLTRVRLKPLFMIGGYAQFSYAFNYWGPQGVNRDTYVIVKKLKKVAF
jgi:nitrate reductase alpha subunit